jgi:hypothetical protein
MCRSRFQTVCREPIARDAEAVAVESLRSAVVKQKTFGTLYPFWVRAVIVDGKFDYSRRL